MSRMFVIATSVAALFAAQPAQAQSDTEGPDQVRLKVMQDTLLIAVNNYSGPANTFVEDNDPNTLQIVFLQKTEQGNSHVSEDGEVVFLSPGTSQDLQQELINAAFDLRYQKRLGDLRTQ